MGAVFGIAGQGSKVLFPEYINNTCNTLLFRGNHLSQYTNNKDIFLGATKLEFENGDRLVYNKDKSIIAACEGEIYNHDELIRFLKTKPSTVSFENAFALVPFLYEENGLDFARIINGVFTIALWDNNEKKLLLVRDHLGSHSMFFSEKDDNLVFATTIKALFKSGIVDKKISSISINNYFAFLAISPPRTMFKNIFAVRPGHLIIYQDNKITEYEYWSLGLIAENYNRNKKEFADELIEIFTDSLKIRSSYGDNYGALISGGIDTSSIAAILASMGKTIKGFSIRFSDKEYSDEVLQEQIYRQYEIERNQIIFGPQQFVEAIMTGVEHLDVPVNDVALAGMYEAMKLAKNNGCTFVFEGEGSDEIFTTEHSMGEFNIQKYLLIPEWFRKTIAGVFADSIPLGNSFLSKLIRFYGRIGMSDIMRRSTWIPGYHDSIRSKILKKDVYKKNSPYDIARKYYSTTNLKDAINIYQYGLTRMFLSDDLLFKNERMSAANGIINRTPFIDYRLVEAAFRIPAIYKIQKPDAESDGTKLIFKEAIKGVIPDEILYRKKTRGFSQPVNKWYRNELNDFAREHILGKNCLAREYLNIKEVKKIYDAHMSGKSNFDYFLSSLIIFELWLRSYLR